MQAHPHAHIQVQYGVANFARMGTKRSKAAGKNPDGGTLARTLCYPVCTEIMQLL